MTLEYCNYSRRIENHMKACYNESKPNIYLIEVINSFSQFLNTLFGGSSNFTLAGEAYRKGNTFMIRILDSIFSAIEKNHCKKSYYYDVARARVVLELHEQCIIT